MRGKILLMSLFLGAVITVPPAHADPQRVAPFDIGRVCVSAYLNPTQTRCHTDASAESGMLQVGGEPRPLDWAPGAWVSSSSVAAYGVSNGEVTLTVPFETHSTGPMRFGLCLTLSQADVTEFFSHRIYSQVGSDCIENDSLRDLTLTASITSGTPFEAKVTLSQPEEGGPPADTRTAAAVKVLGINGLAHASTSSVAIVGYSSPDIPFRGGVGVARWIPKNDVEGGNLITTIRIKQGDTVTLLNDHWNADHLIYDHWTGIYHSITAVDRFDSSTPLFKTGRVESGEEAVVTGVQSLPPGTYYFVDDCCSNYPPIQGKIIVE